MTLSDILENNNIHSDKYARAAISHIYKAFGDNVRSKEWWPWGTSVPFKWYPSKGINTDILEAELLLEKARLKSVDESNTNINNSNDSFLSEIKSLTNLNNYLYNIKNNLKTVNNTSDKINEISEGTSSKIDNIN